MAEPIHKPWLTGVYLSENSDSSPAINGGCRIHYYRMVMVSYQGIAPWLFGLPTFSVVD